MRPPGPWASSSRVRSPSRRPLGTCSGRVVGRLGKAKWGSEAWRGAKCAGRRVEAHPEGIQPASDPIPRPNGPTQRVDNCPRRAYGPGQWACGWTQRTPGPIRSAERPTPHREGRTWCSDGATRRPRGRYSCAVGRSTRAHGRVQRAESPSSRTRNPTSRAIGPTSRTDSPSSRAESPTSRAHSSTSREYGRGTTRNTSGIPARPRAPGRGPREGRHASRARIRRPCS